MRRLINNHMDDASIGVLQARLSEMFPSDESQLAMNVDAPASSSATADQLNLGSGPISASSGGPTHQSVSDDMEDLVDAPASSMAKASGKGVRQDVEQDQVRNATQEFVQELQEAIEL